MLNKKFSSRFTSRFAKCRAIEESEVGNPAVHMSLRRNPIVAGQLEYLNDRGHIAAKQCCKSLLMDLNPEMGTRGKQLFSVQPERLSKETSQADDAIVRSHANWKHEKSAEMTDSRVKRSNKKSVQPVYDFYGVAVATVASKQNLFTLPIGQIYTPTGGAPFAKSVFHTNLVQAGMLDAPKKLLVKAPCTVPQASIAPQDLASFLSTTYFELSISGKPYWQSSVVKTPAGAGPFWQGISTQTPVAGGTMANIGANGWPHSHNVATITDPIPQIPGLDPMEPILGQLVEQNQNFTVLLDPTISGVAAFTTLAAAPTTQFVGNGISAFVYLEGILARAIL